SGVSFLHLRSSVTERMKPDGHPLRGPPPWVIILPNHAAHIESKAGHGDPRRPQNKTAHPQGTRLSAFFPSFRSSGQRFSHRPDHTAVSEGVLDSRRIDSCF